MTLMPCVSVYSQLGNLSLIESMSGLTNIPTSEAEDETDVEEVPNKAKEEANEEVEKNGKTATGKKAAVIDVKPKIKDGY